MAVTTANIFKAQSDKIAHDLDHRKTINFNISKYDEAVQVGKSRFNDLDSAKNIVSSIKNEVIDHLPDLLEEYETNATINGAEVYWAESSIDLIDMLSEIIEEVQAELVVKSKSMVTEEIELNHHLEAQGIKSVETDLGEFIVQVAGEKPYHIVTPAMHKSKKDIAELFNQHFGTDINLSAEEMTGFVREFLRNKFIKADIGVTGGNFICSNEGAIAVTENEGNAYLSASMPRIHVVIVGIEKVIPSISDLAKMWPVLAAHGTGQQLTVYSNVFFGPKQSEEIDGPERMIVFLLDNKRSEIYGDETLRESLKCIRCGACLNGCPVYKNIGGYTYDATYSGPIGSVLTPHFKDFGDYKHLSFASSLCGKCEEVCPVKIPLTELLIYNRQKSDTNTTVNRILYHTFSSRRKLELFNGNTKNMIKTVFQTKVIGDEKELDDFSEKSFSQQWRKDKRT